MKKSILLFFMLLWAGFSSAQSLKGDVNGDGVVNVADVTEIVGIILNGGDDRAVDLGLSVRWASYNVGASAPEEAGGYYAWGETEEKDDYSWSTYKYCRGSSVTMTKYCADWNSGSIDNKTVLEPDDDVAHVKWGGAWRMPTKAEQDELRTKCTWVLETLNNVAGYRVTGPNGKSIFLPLAGCRINASYSSTGAKGQYWSSSLSDYAGCYAFSWNLYNSNYYDWSNDVRYYGFTVRAVCE